MGAPSPRQSAEASAVAPVSVEELVLLAHGTAVLT